MANRNDEYNYIDIDLPSESEKAKYGRNPHSQPTYSKPTNQRNSESGYIPHNKKSVGRKSRKRRKKKSFFAKYSLYFMLAAIVALIIIAVVAFSNCSGGNNAPVATVDESSGLEIITISVQGERVFYNGTEVNGLEAFKNQLEKDFNHNKTINLLNDDADRNTYEDVRTIIQKVEADEIKEKESIAEANETTAPTTEAVTYDTTADGSFLQTYPREDNESDAEEDEEDGYVDNY